MGGEWPMWPMTRKPLSLQCFVQIVGHCLRLVAVQLPQLLVVIVDQKLLLPNLDHRRLEDYLEGLGAREDVLEFPLDCSLKKKVVFVEARYKYVGIQ
jgi:hypothetical protein